VHTLEGSADSQASLAVANSASCWSCWLAGCMLMARQPPAASRRGARGIGQEDPGQNRHLLIPRAWHAWVLHLCPTLLQRLALHLRAPGSLGKSSPAACWAVPTAADGAAGGAPHAGRVRPDRCVAWAQQRRGDWSALATGAAAWALLASTAGKECATQAMAAPLLPLGSAEGRLMIDEAALAGPRCPPASAQRLAAAPVAVPQT
jgi:hypothetical protein